MLDEGSEFGARVARHLREETIVWLTTVTPSGAPLPRPVGAQPEGHIETLTAMVGAATSSSCRHG